MLGAPKILGGIEQQLLISYKTPQGYKQPNLIQMAAIAIVESGNIRGIYWTFHQIGLSIGSRARSRRVLAWRGDEVLQGSSKTDRSNTGFPNLTILPPLPFDLLPCLDSACTLSEDKSRMRRKFINVGTSPSLAADLHQYSSNQSSKNYISPSGKYLRGNLISRIYLLRVMRIVRLGKLNRFLCIFTTFNN